VVELGFDSTAVWLQSFCFCFSAVVLEVCGWWGCVSLSEEVECSGKGQRALVSTWKEVRLEAGRSWRTSLPHPGMRDGGVAADCGNREELF
jgi:hypothetical protein